jgi:hypothetical protein
VGRIYRLEDIQVLVMPGLARRTENMFLDLKASMFSRNLRATLVFPGGIVLGRRVPLS